MPASIHALFPYQKAFAVSLRRWSEVMVILMAYIEVAVSAGLALTIGSARVVSLEGRSRMQIGLCDMICGAICYKSQEMRSHLSRSMILDQRFVSHITLQQIVHPRDLRLDTNVLPGI